MIGDFLTFQTVRTPKRRLEPVWKTNFRLNETRREAGASHARMNFISGWDRQQVHLLPERIEDYVGPDNLVRFLDAWVDTLDLRALGFLFPKADTRGRGAPAYPPADLLRLYL